MSIFNKAIITLCLIALTLPGSSCVRPQFKKPALKSVKKGNIIKPPIYADKLYFQKADGTVQKFGLLENGKMIPVPD